MKKLLFVGAVLLAVIAGAAGGELIARTKVLSSFEKGLYITTYPDNATTVLANKVTSALSGSITYDFPFTPDGGATECDDSTPIYVPGANLGDACSVGRQAVDGGATNSTFTCYVSYADYARVRHCSSVLENPASAVYEVRIIGN